MCLIMITNIIQLFIRIIFIFCYSSVLSFHYTTDGLEPTLVGIEEISEKIDNIDPYYGPYYV